VSVKPGIYLNMPEEEYFAAKALSCSGMKQLAVSPLNYWHRNLNPDFVRGEETYPQRLGKAVHCRLLEPSAFADRYAVELSADDVPGALITMDDMKAFLAEHGLSTTAKRKQDLIDRIQDSGIPAIIWDNEVANHAQATAGRVLLGKVEADGIEKLASAVLADQYAAATLSGGVPEVSFFVRDPETGVMLKARMDYVKAAATIDLKTFSNSRGKAIDKVVYDAIYYEAYHLQCVFYHRVRELVRHQLTAGEIKVHGEFDDVWLNGLKANADHRFGFVFVESMEPFDLRIVELRESERPGAGPNIYWMDGIVRMTELTHLYADCLKRYGARPWREPQKPHLLADTDIPQLMFA
jgi:hypothetical protein